MLADAAGELAVQELVAEDERHRYLACEQRAHDGRHRDESEEDERRGERMSSDEVAEP